jgi:hypothetical protein
MVLQAEATIHRLCGLGAGGNLGLSLFCGMFTGTSNARAVNPVSSSNITPADERAFAAKGVGAKPTGEVVQETLPAIKERKA